jgi:GTP-binding protein Era
VEYIFADSLMLVVPENYRSGFVCLLGLPNAGKSTLLNAILQTPLAIVSAKAQTTRRRLLGICSTAKYQMIFVDTPGVLEPAYELHHRMLGVIDKAVADADVLLYVAEPHTHINEQRVHRRLQHRQIPLVIAINKADLSQPPLLQARAAELTQSLKPDALLIISALHNFNIHPLTELLVPFLPQAPPWYDTDQLTDQPERQLAAEKIREKILNQYRQEIPYGVEVTILEYRELEDRLHIEAEIHVERNSQKGILIGNKGLALKRVGIAAREDLEMMLAKPVYLGLYVRVAKDWKNSPRWLKQFGYE